MKPRIASLLATTFLLLSACAANEGGPVRAGPTSTATLENIYWKVTTLNGAPVVVAENQREPHVVFHSEGKRVTAFGGCNHMSGIFEVEGEKLTLSRMAATMMACDVGMEQEQALHDAFNRVARWKIRGETLELFDIGGETLATLEKSVPREKSRS